MMNFNFPAKLQIDSLAKKALVVAFVWLLAMATFLTAVALQRSNSEKLGEACSVLNAATVLKGYKLTDTGTTKADNSLTSITDILNAAGLSNRVSQLDSSSSGTLIKADRVYPDEFEKLVSMLGDRGVQITAAEIRAVNVNSERLLFIRLSLGGQTL